MNTPTLKSLIEKAITKEVEAYEFYMSLHARVDDLQAKDTLQFLAGEEQKHRAFLVSWREGKKKFAALDMNEVVDYQVAQYLEQPDIQKNMSSAEVYLVAAHREWNAYNFYINLSELQPQGEVKEMLQLMANQELRHKEKVEYLYANTAFPQTDGG